MGYHINQRYESSKPHLIKMLAEMSDPSKYKCTVYIPPRHTFPELGDDASAVSLLVGESETGLSLFFQKDRVVCVVPPFPIVGYACSKGVDTKPLVKLLSQDLMVGVILVRLGRYAVGILRGDSILVSKSDTGYVKSRHKAGGTSQRRFERSRERLIREFLDKACRATSETMSPFRNQIDYLMLGGESHTLRRFLEKCTFTANMTLVTLNRKLKVDRPRSKVLTKIGNEVWKSRVYILESSER